MNNEPPNWLYENISEAAKHASRIYITLILFIFYCVLTLLGTSDRQIILDESTELPILGSSISFSKFCIAVPVMGIILFIYFQVYLQKYKRLVSKINTYTYNSDSPQRIYPWIISIVEESQNSFLAFIQKALVAFSVWYITPIFLSIIPIWLVRTHQPIQSYISSLIPAAGALIVITYRAQFENMNFQQFFKRYRIFITFTFLILVWCLFVSIICIPLSLKGETLSIKKGVADDTFHRSFELEIKSSLFSWWCVNLSRQNLTTKPENDSPMTYWAHLEKARLEGSNLNYSILEKANLTDARLQNSYIMGTVFKKAKLDRADLSGVLGVSNDFQEAEFLASKLGNSILDFSNFRGAKLGQSSLNNSSLTKTDFKGAKLYNCKFRQTELYGANFDGADVRSVDFSKACLTRASFNNANMDNTILDGACLFKVDLHESKNLKVEQLCKAYSLWEAKLDWMLLSEVKKSCPDLLDKQEKVSDVGLPWRDCDPNVIVQ